MELKFINRETVDGHSILSFSGIVIGIMKLNKELKNPGTVPEQPGRKPGAFDTV